MLLDKPNVLVLDEPTNHLDITSREALEGALAGFDGTILCVSHDRYFLEKVAARLLVLNPPNVVDFAGRYSQWVRRQAEEAEEKSESQTPRARSPKPQPRNRQRRSPRANRLEKRTIPTRAHSAG